MLLNNRYKKLDDNDWSDEKTGKRFSHKQHRLALYYGRHEDGSVARLSRRQGPGFNGKEFHYLDLPENYLEGPHGLKYFKELYYRIGIQQQEGEIFNIHHNTELIYQTNCKLPFRDKTVLIIGAGPSTNLTNWNNLEYDYVFACNNFFMNEKVENEKPFFISLAANIDFSNEKLQDYFNKNDCIIGLEPEHLKPHEIDQFGRLYNKFRDKICIYQTRYCSALGIGARQIIFSILMGAKKIYFCGHDQYYLENEEAAHAYENNKRLPKWRIKYGKDFQDRQLIILSDYIMKLKETYDFEIYNLAEEQECCAWSFATKAMFPITKKIRSCLNELPCVR